MSILLIALGLVAVYEFRADILDWRVAEQAKALAVRLSFNQGGVPIGLQPSKEGVDWIYESLKDELAYRVFDASGRVVLYSPAGERFWASDGPVAYPWDRKGSAFKREGSVIHLATERVEHGGRTWFLQFAGSERVADLFQVVFAFPLVGEAIVLFSLVLLVFFGASSYLTLRRTFAPLRAISAAATAISPRSLHARLPAQGVPTEVAPLVESFNRTLDRLERGYRVQQEFLAAAAHELKTPLALIRAQIELSDASADRDSLLRDVEHMARQVQQLLLLAEASELRNYSLAPVDVLEVANEACAYLKRMAQAAGVRIELHTDRVRPTWLADRGALFTLLKNLLENAIQHAPSGTTVSVYADAMSLCVRDWGIGADEEQLTKMFMRFWRGAHRRDHGAGLGLAICREVAEAHGWSLFAQRAEPGLRFVLLRRSQQQDGQGSPKDMPTIE